MATTWLWLLLLMLLLCMNVVVVVCFHLLALISSPSFLVYDVVWFLSVCGARYKTRPGLTYHYKNSHKDFDRSTLNIQPNNNLGSSGGASGPNGGGGNSNSSSGGMPSHAANSNPNHHHPHHTTNSNSSTGSNSNQHLPHAPAPGSHPPPPSHGGGPHHHLQHQQQQQHSAAMMMDDNAMHHGDQPGPAPTFTTLGAPVPSMSAGNSLSGLGSMERASNSSLTPPSTPGHHDQSSLDGSGSEPHQTISHTKTIKSKSKYCS